MTSTRLYAQRLKYDLQHMLLMDKIGSELILVLRNFFLSYCPVGARNLSWNRLSKVQMFRIYYIEHRIIRTRWDLLVVGYEHCRLF